jgi:Ohr subfamily peroxiredoxin
MKVLYTAQATANEGRDGRVESSDGFLKFELTKPKGLGGSEKPGTTNPEQLFACGYSACFARRDRVRGEAEEDRAERHRGHRQGRHRA